MFHLLALLVNGIKIISKTKKKLTKYVLKLNSLFNFVLNLKKMILLVQSFIP